MGLYVLLSDQAKVSVVQAESVAARNALAAYDGDFDGVMPLVKRSLGLSFRHIGMVFLPALAASIPLLLLLVWISIAYGFHPPEPGAEVTLRVSPPGAAVTWEPSAVGTPEPDAYTIPWPVGGGVTARSPAGERIVTIPVDVEIPVVHQRLWWNALVGNPAGYVPDGAPIREIRLDLEPKTFLGFGPEWARTWEVPFLTLVFVCSLAIKIVFKIH